MSSRLAGMVRGSGLAAAVVFMGAIPSAVMAAKPVAPPPPPPPPAIPAPTPANGQLFSWFQTGSPAPAQYVGAPFLSDGNAGAVDAYFKTLGANDVRAVKVLNPISGSTASLIFNNPNYHVSYVFGDLEGASAATNAAQLASQVRGASSNPNQSSKAYIGNFGFGALAVNLQKPNNYANQGQHSFSGYNYAQYSAAGLSMSNIEAYPGSPSFRNKAGGDAPSGGGSYKNIRTSLFTLPIWRVSETTSDAAAMKIDNHQNIPWTANFNNWGNLALDNDRDASNGYKFEPGKAMVAKTVNGVSYPAMTAAQTADQLLSRRDFATMVTHMRMRGADSINLLESGLSTASNSDMESDARAGWNGEMNLGQIFSQADHELLIDGQKDNGPYVQGGRYGDNSTIIVDGKKMNIDQAGALFSGAYSLSLGKLDVLISNMDDQSRTITLPDKIGNYALAEKDFTVGGGSHLMVEYSLMGPGAKKGWQVAAQHVPYTAIANSRNGFGIPEPGTLSLLAVGAILGLNRRTRKDAAKA
ncbi:MAG TPA: PEP-CTERM sorting domain-containing protein [Tepidisphaeraceae bacterium]|jgi:hypothetical protein